MKLFTSACLTVLLASCTSTPDVPEIAYDDLTFTQAEPIAEPLDPVQIVELPAPLPLPGQLKQLLEKGDTASRGNTKPSDRIKSANSRAKIEPTNAGYINAIQVYPYSKGALYQLYAAVNQVSDIALQRGETLVSVSAGDTVRWVVGDTRSGEGANAQTHILVKPTAEDLKTNLVIATDRRTYHLELKSTAETYMASLSWAYPHDDLVALKARNNRAISNASQLVSRNFNLQRLRFRYAVSGDAVPWKPVRVFDDQQKVYIQFPSGLRQGDAPPLFVSGDDGKPALVNYRVRGNYYIVDRLFAAAELRLGEEPQKVVRITRTDGVKRGGRS